MLVYPGGDWETFRPSWHSDRIEFAGRKGFIKLALERGVPIVPVVAIGGQETALFATRGERAAKATGWAKLTRIKVLPVAFGPPFGATVLDLPGRLPLPAKITVEVRQPIDLVERFGPRPEPENVYEDDHGRNAGQAVRAPRRTHTAHHRIGMRQPATSGDLAQDRVSRLGSETAASRHETEPASRRLSRAAPRAPVRRASGNANVYN